MINSEEELISQAKEIPDIESRIKFIMNYFLDNVQYDYSQLFLYSKCMGTMSAFSLDLYLQKNKIRAEGDGEISLVRKVIEGESRIFNDIIALRDKNSGNYAGFIEALKDYLTIEFSSILENNDLVVKNVELALEKIQQRLREKTIGKIDDKEIEMNYDISTVLTDFMIDYKKYFVPEFHNGLITKGVCRDYTEYIIPILQKSGIEAHKIIGKSEYPHAWIIAKVGDKYKSIDLTRAVAIRDHAKGIPEEQRSEDWILSDIEDTFKMQETRSIKSIDGKQLPNEINGQNYDETTFFKIMEELQEAPDSTFPNSVNRGLEKGITESETQEAENAETTHRGERGVNRNE